MDPFGWRIASAVVGALMVLVMCRLARRLTGSTAARAASPACCSASTGCTSCSPGWPCSTSSWRSSCSAASPAWSTTATGSAPGWPGSCPEPVADATASGRSAACCSGPGCSPAGSASGWRSAPSGRRSSRWRRSACWPGPGAAAPGASFGVRWPVLRSALVDGVPAFVQLVGRRVPRLRRHLDRLAGPRPRLRGAPLLDAVHPFTTTGHCDGKAVSAARRRRWPTAPSRTRRARRARAVAALAVVLPPGRLRLPHPLPQLHATTPTSRKPVGLAAAQPPGRGRRPTPTSSRAPRAATPRRAATACARCCCSARRSLWWGGALALLFAVVMWVGAPRLAVRLCGGRRRVDLAALADVRRPADLPLLRGARPCRSWCWR